MNQRSGLTVGIEHLTRAVKRSIESALTPAPLFLAACRERIVLGWRCGGGWGVSSEGGLVVCRAL